jgi:hypothetical protein
VRTEKLVTETGGQLANPEKQEYPPFVAATKQRLVKTVMALCMMQLECFWSI